MSDHLELTEWCYYKNNEKIRDYLINVNPMHEFDDYARDSIVLHGSIDWVK